VGTYDHQNLKLNLTHPYAKHDSAVLFLAMSQLTFLCQINELAYPLKSFFAVRKRPHLLIDADDTPNILTTSVRERP